MNLVLILPRERTILLRRRFAEHAAGEPIMHALDSDIFYHLCAKTDWETGRIGERSAVSYARIAAALNEDIPRKHKLQQMTRKCVYNSVQRLITAGLLHSESLCGKKKNRLVLDRLFWCAMLQKDKNKSAPDRQQLGDLMAVLIKKKVINTNDLEKSSPKKGNAILPADGIYQYSKDILNYSAIGQEFSMTLTWQADKKYVDRFLQASGFSGSQIKKVWFGKYVQYWSQYAEVQRTQREWSAHFANHMQSYLLRPRYKEISEL